MKKRKNILCFICLFVILFIILCVFVCYRAIHNRYINTRDNNIPHNSKVIVNETLKSDAATVINDYLINIFYTHSNRYCGILDYDDTYISNNDVYYFNKTFKSISEIKNNYLSIMTDKYFNDNLSDKFIEHDGKLYCLFSGRGSLDYEEGSVSIKDITIVYDVIVVTGSYRTVQSDLNPSESFNFKVGMLKVNDKLVINSYEETR